jgi:hypothetical protein
MPSPIRSLDHPEPNAKWRKGISHLLQLRKHRKPSPSLLRLKHELLSLCLELLGPNQQPPPALLLLARSTLSVVSLVGSLALGIGPFPGGLDVSLAGLLGLGLDVPLRLAGLGPLLLQLLLAGEFCFCDGRQLRLILWSNHGYCRGMDVRGRRRMRDGVGGNRQPQLADQ